MSAPLAPHLARRAEQARLGPFVGPLAPPRAQSIRTLGIGVALGALVAVGRLTLLAGSWPVTVLLVIAGAVAVGFVGVGVIEILPGPGKLLMFEEGFVHVSTDGTVEAQTYGEAPEGAEVRGRALASAESA